MLQVICRKQPRWGVLCQSCLRSNSAQKLYYGGNSTRGVIPCAGCHGGKANGNDLAAFPRIGGQHSAYIATQLKLFRAAGREDDEPTIEMRMNDSS